MEGITGENLLILLERRIDNVVFRLGLANTRRQARQIVRHGHIAVNGKRLDIPSALVRVGDVVTVMENSRAKNTSKAWTKLWLPKQFRLGWYWTLLTLAVR